MTPVSNKRFQVECSEPPVEAALKSELVPLWEGTFDTPYDFLQPVLAGREAEINRDAIYRVRMDGRVVATSHVTTAHADPTLGGLGEVATAPEYRRHGFAAAVCEQARDDFVTRGGEALFLGMGNPDAARVYHRLGWRKMAGADAMVLLRSGQSPESFLVDFYRGAGSTEVREATPAARVAMIPLIHTPHDWKVLDANLSLCSTRYQTQSSVMGLYPRYEQLQAGDGGAFELRCSRDRLVGLATARLQTEGVCRVDGFAHALHADGWSDLIEAACRWGRELGAGICEAAVCVEDEEKRQEFEALGFAVTDPGPEMSVAGRTLSSRLLTRR